MKKMFKGIMEGTWEFLEPETEWTEVWTGEMSLIDGGTFYISDSIKSTCPTRYTFSSGLSVEGIDYAVGTNLGTQVVIAAGQNESQTTLLTGSASFDVYGYLGLEVYIHIAPPGRNLEVDIKYWADNCWTPGDMRLHGTLTLTKIEQQL